MSSKFRPVEYTRQDAQLLPHEGFKTGVIGMRHEQTPKTNGERTPILARPPAWTGAELNCLNKWDDWDNEATPVASGTGRRTKPNVGAKNRARVMCTGCPMAPAALGGTSGELGSCLESSLREERGTGAQYRHGIRGGLLPVERANLDTQNDLREQFKTGPRCRRGHERKPETTYTRPDGKRECLICAQKAGRRYAQRQIEGAA